MDGEKNPVVKEAEEKAREERGREAARRFFSGPKKEPAKEGFDVETSSREQVQTSPAHGKFAATEGGGGIFDGMTDAILEGMDEKTKGMMTGFKRNPTKKKASKCREKQGRDL